uniref:F-box domain-containing protein n=1 Tax=Spongospora subterranea TaxID=70186 RepID=A0A0H5QK62_9EUKA|eukprot:CRZ02012.1 hypothetical protein [Spongospora subterranea]
MICRDALTVLLELLDPVDLVRAAGVCIEWRHAATKANLWRQFTKSSSIATFIDQPLKRRPEYMFLKNDDWLMLNEEQRCFVYNNPTLNILLRAGVFTIWMLKWSSADQLEALDKIMAYQNDNIQNLIWVHRAACFTLQDVLDLLAASYSRSSLLQAMFSMRSATVRNLLKSGVVTFTDLVQTSLSAGRSLMRGGLQNLASERLCTLITQRRASLHQIASLTIPESIRIKSDFVWQYIIGGWLSFTEAKKLSLATSVACEQAELFRLVTTKQISLQRALQLPEWTLYEHNVLRLWEVGLISRTTIESISRDWSVLNKLRDRSLAQKINSGVIQATLDSLLYELPPVLYKRRTRPCDNTDKNEGPFKRVIC